MNDLLLWHQLLDLEAADVAALRAQLAAFAPLHIRQRYAWFGVLLGALEHADPEVRALAAGALRGADGLPAFRTLVRALRDPEASVRLAAVEALRESAVGHPARWIHAVFHPDADVRRAAASRPGPPQGDAYAFHLLADPACHADVLRRLDGPEPSLALPPN